MNIRKLFVCRWDKMKNPPNWIWIKAHKMNHETIRHFKGKTFVYKIIRGTPVNQGDFPVKYYRRLRSRAMR